MAQSPPLLQNTEAHPVALSLLLLRRYGPEWLLWESETLEAKLQEDFGGASRINFEKIQAMKALHLAEEFWTSWEVFAWCTAALNGRLADFEVMQVPTLPECLYSVSCAKHTRDDVPWSGEVAAFVGAVHLHDEVLVPTPPLEFSEVPSLGGTPGGPSEGSCEILQAVLPAGRR